MKSVFVSKMVWVNLITTVIAVLELFTTSNVLPAGALPWLVLVVGILNLVLRIWFTDTALTI